MNLLYPIPGKSSAWLLLIACSLCLSGKSRDSAPDKDLSIVVLGIAQDGGYPHAGCSRACCAQVYAGKQQGRSPVSLGVIDRQAGKVFLLEASPEFPEQWRHLQKQAGMEDKRTPDGIFLTHAHIGHYTGLMYLGREVMGARQTPVWAMPRMEKFLRDNGPWSQLVSLQNIELHSLKEDSTVQLTERLRITPFRVPHRDEFSETVGYRIESPERKVLFIPDIDKWERWQRQIEAELANVDVALLDATFFKDGELSGRSMKEVPHPFVVETMDRFARLPASEKKKVTFIHFNHTNPLLWDRNARREVQKAGFSLASEGMVIPL